MSSKRAVLLAKDRCFSSKSSNQFYGKALNNNEQFINIILNQNHKFEDIKFEQSKSTQFSKKSQNNNDFVDFKNDSKKATLNDWKKIDTQNYYESLKTQEMKNEWENEAEKYCNKSTLSLHIETHENGNVTKNDAFTNKTSKSVHLPAESQITSDFLKQQNQELMNPEIMQFKTTQKLLNLDAFEIKEMPGTSSLLRSGVSRFAATSLFNSATSPAIPQQQQIRTIRHDLRLPDDFPEPWPYKEKGFTRINAIFDRTQARFNENSKLIVVEGNLGSGKSKVAKEIADTLGFHYIPDFRIEELVVDRYGIDLRDYYHLFPKSFRIPTYDMFYKNPADDNTARMSERCFVSRFDQYLNALAHILNTGQGVVMERSPFSDFVFTNAMRAKDYIGIEYFKHYFYMRKRTMPQIQFWPHAVVYIDTPVEKCLENIKQRGNSDQIATLDAKFLSVIRDSYKDSLREYRRHSKMLSYDWTKPGDTDTIVEDLERLDLDFFEWHSGDVLEEWYTTVDEVGWAGWRRYYTDKMDAHSRSFGGYRIHEVSELYINPRDEGHFVNVLINEVYKSRFTPGFNKHLGDNPMSGAKIWRLHQGLPEPWFDYWYHEHWLHQMMPHEVQFDSKSKESYDPDYLHHAH